MSGTLTFNRVARIGKLVERGLKSKNPEVVALAKAAQYLGRALKREREASTTACVVCVFNDAAYLAVKSGGWNVVCRECVPAVEKDGWVVTKR